MDPGVIVIIALSAFLIVWYVLAGNYNRRRGVTIYRWLARGLEEIGEVSKAKWIGSSGTGANLVVAKPAKPFQKIEAEFYLETREIFPYWLVTHLMGKRDELTIQATLRSAPKVEYIIQNSHLKSSAVLNGDSDRATFEQALSPAGFVVYIRGGQAEGGRERLNEFLSSVNQAVESVHLKRSAPHLIIRTDMRELLGQTPESIFVSLMAWVESTQA